MSGAWAADGLVHYGKKNPRTGLIGSAWTPTRDIMTMCQSTWPDMGRPRRTLLAHLVTCPTCRRFPQPVY